MPFCLLALYCLPPALSHFRQVFMSARRVLRLDIFMICLVNNVSIRIVNVFVLLSQLNQDQLITKVINQTEEVLLRFSPMMFWTFLGSCSIKLDRSSFLTNFRELVTASDEQNSKLQSLGPTRDANFLSFQFIWFEDWQSLWTICKLIWDSQLLI